MTDAKLIFKDKGKVMMNSIVSVDFQREGNHGEMRSAEKWLRDGIWFVEGIQGRRFSLNIMNRTGRRIEVVVSVDGLDVNDGETASITKRGLVIGPWDSFKFEGFRTSLSDVATFRFTNPGESIVSYGYAGVRGNPTNIGVIGIAIFQEKTLDPQPWPIRPTFWSEKRLNRTVDMSYSERSTSVTCNTVPQASPSGQSLGTDFGESRQSQIGETMFLRATLFPHSQFTIRYENQETLRFMGFVMSRIDSGSGTPVAFPGDGNGFCKPPAIKASV